ncbi:hypothetical protein [Hydrogenimonas sp.]|uniref:hypothetical protein n=1 Tax=Hydrogenimonas sp. TaxID=2231112 RepID=UPI0026323FFE|nr:hypothetical protein [Hydrogenimonas sp.]
MVIKGAKVVRESGVEEIDVRIEEGKIVELGTALPGDTFDAHGKYLLPGMIDIGVMVYDGKLRGGTLEKLSKKACANGFSTVVLSSLCTPRIDNEITLEFAKSQAELCRETNILTLLSGVNEAGGLSDCSILLKDGAVGIEFESHVDGNLIRRLMEYAQMHDVTLFCHANDPALQGDGVMHEGEISGRLGLAGIPPLGESSQVARIGEFAKRYGVDVVILGASTIETVEICRKNPHLKAQLSLHHLMLTDAACDDYDTSGKIWPPLRDDTTRHALVEAVKKGDVPMLTSLHSPVSRTAKDAVFSEAAYGIDGMNIFLPMLYTTLVKPGFLTMTDLTKLTSFNAAGVIGQQDQRGAIEEGYMGEMILFDPDALCTVDDRHSPYSGRTFHGAVEKIEI